METDRERELQDAIDAVLARLRVQEFALLELLRALPQHNAMVMASGLRARVNAWTLDAGPSFTPSVDDTTAEQLATLLFALDAQPIQAQQHFNSREQ